MKVIKAERRDQMEQRDPRDKSKVGSQRCQYQCCPRLLFCLLGLLGLSYLIKTTFNYSLPYFAEPLSMPDILLPASSVQSRIKLFEPSVLNITSIVPPVIGAIL